MAIKKDKVLPETDCWECGEKLAALPPILRPARGVARLVSVVFTQTVTSRFLRGRP
jgi:hypothetical protein